MKTMCFFYMYCFAHVLSVLNELVATFCRSIVNNIDYERGGISLASYEVFQTTVSP